MVQISSEHIDPSKAYDLIGKHSSGSVVLHYAVVKESSGNEHSTTCIDYQADEKAENELETIAAELREKWRLEDVLLMRRTGCLRVGDIISLVAASSPNSEDAFAACKHGIGRLKKMTTIRKTEMYV
jgi:molybdopterin synthase catalytic subunit